MGKGETVSPPDNWLDPDELLENAQATAWREAQAMQEMPSLR